ncbi:MULTISPECIES: hypothetical protein [Streptomyces]|uniref:Uncharacterized protein n=1 Tax=Streptomyces doudnae TaxID=3075536 RepID=A0ABD5F091_9ACTN|nr:MULTISPECIES: hypothetical protein [unclassified Streptomyces]MDT0440363.1 hypothetical protein [Streptomyces sp. DSM 41981]MYQ68579.1 hypothetical protein [Streptomyces sp. SID4950]
MTKLLPPDAYRGDGRLPWACLFTAAADPFGFRQFDTDDDEGEDVRYAVVGQLSVTYWINRPRNSLTVLNIVWLG